MSKIILLDNNLLKLIYSYLKLRDKLAFALTNRKFHRIFFNYPLLDIIFRINHHNGYPKAPFLFRNIVNVTVISAKVDNNYLSMFENLRDLDVSLIEFPSFKKVQVLVGHLSKTLLNVTVMNNHVKELFKLGASFYQRSFNLTVNKKRQTTIDLNLTSPSKRLRTPSPVCLVSDKQLEECLLHRSRMKYAIASPEDFIPAGIFKKFPQLSNQYKAVINTAPLENKMNTPSAANIEDCAKILKGMLVHSVVQMQNNNWIFVTQVEVYYHDKEIDDVAQVDRKNEYSDILITKIEKRQEGKGSWYELCFWCQKFEVVATGGFYRREDDSNKLGAFLGVTIPSFLGKDINPIILSPSTPVETVLCVRMLRNYKKNASLKKLCFKSFFFANIEFTTPNQLNLYEKEPNSFVSVCSKLINLVIYDNLNEEEYQALENSLIHFEYWKSLRFDEIPAREDITTRLDHLKEAKRGSSISKRLLIELILTRELNLTASMLMILYNGIIYPRVKAINKVRVKKMQK